MRKYGAGYETVQRAPVSALPEPRKKMRPRPTHLNPYKPVIDAILKADLTAPRKQRHTVKRIYDRLLDEHNALDISYQMVRTYVAERRGEIRLQAGKLVTCYLFAFRLSYSGKAVHRIFASAGRSSKATSTLNVLDGVPTGKVRYDNLRATVAQVLGLSRRRVEAERWTAFRSHYGLDAPYRQPDIRGAHEKGGAEGQIGWFRRNHLVSPFRKWARSPSSRRSSTGGTSRTTPAASTPARARSASTSRPSSRSWRHCRKNRSRQAGCRHHESTATARSASDEPLLGPGPADRAHCPRHAPRLRTGGLRRPRGGRPARAAHRPQRFPPRSRPLPGSPDPQARRLARCHSPGRGQGCWPVHPDPRRLVGRRGQSTRRTRRHPGPDRSPPAQPPPAPRTTRRGAGGGLEKRCPDRDTVALEARKAADADTEPQQAPPSPGSGSQAGMAQLPAAVRAHLPPDKRPLPPVAHYDQLLRLRPPDRPTPS